MTEKQKYEILVIKYRNTRAHIEIIKKAAEESGFSSLENFVHYCIHSKTW